MRGDPAALLQLQRRALLTACAACTLPLRPLRVDAAVETKDLGTTVSSKLLTSPAETTDALGDINWGAPKVTGLSTDEMARRIDTGLRRECWFVTGRSMPELFSNSFSFSDPQVLHHHARPPSHHGRWTP